MSGKKKHKENGNRDRNLRDNAEDQLARRSDVSLKQHGKTPVKLIHELQMHRIELQMQNEELKTSRAEVEAGLALYAELYDFAPISYFTLDRDGTIRRVNLTGARLLDMERGQLIGRRFGLFVSDEDRPAFNAFLENVFASRKKETCAAALSKEKKRPPSPERSGSRHFGETGQIIVHIEAIASEDGQECRAVISDITERKQVEEALLIKTMLLEAQSETSIDGILAMDNEGRSILFNKRFGELWKIPQHILDTKDEAVMLECVLKQLKDPDEFGRKVAYLYEHRAEQSREEIEFTDGRYLDRYSSPLLSTNGQHLGRIWFFRDITDRKRAEEALRESEALFRKLFEDHAAVKLIIDPDTGSLIDANEAAAQYYGWSRERLKAMKITEINTLAPEEVKKEMEKARANKRIHFEFRHRLADGSIRDVAVFSSSIENKGKVFLHSIIHDITGRKRAEERLQETLESLKTAVGTTIQVMVSAVETRDPYTAGHQLRVADLARAIATEMGFTQDRIEGIRMAGSIHDIGKLSIPAETLSKPTKLTKTEFSLIKEHSQKGYRILKDVESHWPLAEIVYQHHERMNGSGYPRNLKGDDIFMEARILAVADVVEAMASHRPYRPALGIDMALEEIEKNRGTLYDEVAADACLSLFREKGFQLGGK